jgi:SAM-dependent methyltransferase
LVEQGDALTSQDDARRAGGGLGHAVDFGKTASDYARHRAGFPDRFFERLFKDGIVTECDRVLDLGTGTGTIARGLAKRGCLVTALDPSEAMLEQAGSLDRAAGVTVRYVQGRAEQTGLPDAGFDVVTAGQCWHWFDRPRVGREARRLLVPSGRIVLAHFDWLPLPGNVVEATETLIRAHNPAWDAHGGTGIHPWDFADLTQAGFVDIESFSFDVSVPYSHEGWLGRIRASAGVAASLPPDAVERFDAAHRELLAQNFADDPLQIPHRVFAVFGCVKSSLATSS